MRGLSLRLLASASLMVVGVTGVVQATTGALGAVVVGRLAEHPSWLLVSILAAVNLTQIVAGGAQWRALAVAVGRAEQAVRRTLLARVLGQPMETLQTQGAGELIDRVDDDPAQLGALVRGPALWTGQAILGASASWIVAGLSWWPAWPLFLAIGVACVFIVRRRAGRIAQLKVQEEAAWSAHGAGLEEAIAAGDDLRAAQGREFVVRRYVTQASALLRRIDRTGAAAVGVTARVGMLLNALVAVVALLAAATAAGVPLFGGLTTGRIVELWFLIVGFVGALANVTGNLPQIQSGLGAAQRINALLRMPQEPSSGAELPHRVPRVVVHGLVHEFDRRFRLGPISLTVAAGQTLALVGRTGSGKSTLAKLLLRAIEPRRGEILFDGHDVLDFALPSLRRRCAVVAQTTELIAGSVADNVQLYADATRADVEDAFTRLGLTEWIARLPDGLDTVIGAGGTELSAGEAQLVAFARLMIRDPVLVVLDEATARMDAMTARRLTTATERLLEGRTAVVIAHRLETVRHADRLVVLSGGAIAEQGSWDELAVAEGAFASSLRAAGLAGDEPLDRPEAAEAGDGVAEGTADGFVDSAGDASTALAATSDESRPSPSLARTVLKFLVSFPRWGFWGDLSWLVGTLIGPYGVVTGALWGALAATLGSHRDGWQLALPLALCLLLSPWLLAIAARLHPRWMAAISLTVRLGILRGRLGRRTPAPAAVGETLGRAFDSTRLANFTDEALGIPYGVLFAVLTGLVAGGWAAGLIAGAVMVLCALVAITGVGVVGRAGRAAVDARAASARVLGSVLETASTIKQAGVVSEASEHAASADARRIAASIRENTVGSLPWLTTGLLVQLGVVVGWALHTSGQWTLPTALLLNTVLGNFSWFGFVTGQVVTGTPATRSWLSAVARLAGTEPLASLPAGVDLGRGRSAAAAAAAPIELRELAVRDFTVSHADGSRAVTDVRLTVSRGEFIAVIGRVGSGKSSLLAGLAGLRSSKGDVLWNGNPMPADRAREPGQMAYVAQVPALLSGSVEENIHLGRLERISEVATAAADAGLGVHTSEAPSAHEPRRLRLADEVGHRGRRLSGGQAQRVAIARALSAEPQLLIADDPGSGLDPETEVAMWQALRRREITVVAAVSRRSVLERADRVVVLDRGRVAAVAPWSLLEPEWSDLAG
ncbi:ATP-binding cassette domain-containing protein [Gryllotalpicola reticulitermitis]|uniref:ATP-binding cassette domain-containing protein n=1 Tax=Gryllotalpicola reticulitermitis TaxID=1184153 RepID=A0ABV8QBZ8_9MICO